MSCNRAEIAAAAIAYASGSLSMARGTPRIEAIREPHRPQWRRLGQAAVRALDEAEASA